LKSNTSIFILIVTLLLVPSIALSWSGKVVDISDGDTITVLNKGRGERIRLYGIDCPEKRQDFGQKAKHFTSRMVFGKIVEVKVQDTDRYGRTVGLVYSNGQCLNAEIIKAGLAWVCTKYCKLSLCDDLKAYEETARSSKVGLWSHPDPVPPWEYRRGKRKTSTKINTGSSVVGVTYHGNVKSKVFHKPGCRYYSCKNCTAEFDSRDDIIKAGYRPCKICRP
jgi:endonuclease YncB( thermonuclease family)